MHDRTVATARILSSHHRLEVRLHSWLAEPEIGVVRNLPGSRWDRSRRLWVIPHPDHALAVLEDAWGAGAIRIVDDIVGESRGVRRGEQARRSSVGEVAPGSRSASEDSPIGARAGPVREDRLERTRDALVLRGYSARTRKVYLGHLRRFLEWCHREALVESGDVAASGQKYMLELLRHRRVSRSYQNQVVSALRFFLETVLGEPRQALLLPRPRKERPLPVVLSRGGSAPGSTQRRQSRGVHGRPSRHGPAQHIQRSLGPLFRRHL